MKWNYSLFFINIVSTAQLGAWKGNVCFLGEHYYVMFALYHRNSVCRLPVGCLWQWCTLLNGLNFSSVFLHRCITGIWRPWCQKLRPSSDDPHFKRDVEYRWGMNRDSRKSRNHGSRDFSDFRRLPRLLPNAVILLISPNSSIFAQYKLQLVLWFQHKINSVNK